MRWCWLAALLASGCGATPSVRAGDAAIERGDLLAAEAAYRDALAHDPERADALYGLGWTYHLAGQRDAARDAFEQCVRLHPESPLGYKGLGSVAMAEDNPGAAEDWFGRALERGPEDARVRQSLGLLKLKTDDPAGALAIFDELAAADPGRAEFHQARAEALLRLDRPDDALAAADQAVAAASAPRVTAMASLTRARTLMAVAAGRVDPKDCARTAPPVLTWLAEADRSLDRVQATGIPLPELTDARREVRRRRGGVEDQCPGLTGG